MCTIPFRGLNFIRCNNSTAGIRNANVLPEPVLAAPRTSLPARSGGIAFACTGVIVEKSMPWRALIVGSESSRVEKSGHGSTAEVEATPLAVNLIITGIFKSDNNWVERTTIDEDEARRSPIGCKIYLLYDHVLLLSQ